MFSEIDKIVFPKEEIQNRVRELAEEINDTYEDKELLLVGILKGCMFFMADLMRFLKVPLSIDFISISSYGSSTQATGAVRLLKDLDASIYNRHVLVVEDIVDTGLTLGYLLKNLKERSPASLRVCTLLNKPDYRIVRIPLDFCGFELDRRFVVGYGLDYQEKYRHLPFICTLKKEVCPL
jgi:hypoxanthine phosphoribosyltransferase